MDGFISTFSSLGFVLFLIDNLRTNLCDRVKVTGNKMINNFYIKKVSKVYYSDDIFINYCNVLFPKMVRKKNRVVLYWIYIS